MVPEALQARGAVEAIEALQATPQLGGGSANTNMFALSYES